MSPAAWIPLLLVEMVAGPEDLSTAGWAPPLENLGLDASSITDCRVLEDGLPMDWRVLAVNEQVF